MCRSIRSVRWRRRGRRRIEQRWFVGAHSNVGGGYASNPLAQQPLAWLLEGARDAGLICDSIPKNGAPDKRLGPRDSFMEFATPYWTTALRAKRTYRIIDPDPEIRAERRLRKESSAFMLVNINEQVDPGAIEYYARQRGCGAAAEPRGVRRTEEGAWQGSDVARGAHAHTSVDGQRRRGPYIVLALWATLAAGGILAVDLVFRIWTTAWPPAWWLAVAAAVFALVDWAESCQNFTMAARGSFPCPPRLSRFHLLDACTVRRPLHLRHCSAA